MVFKSKGLFMSDLIDWRAYGSRATRSLRMASKVSAASTRASVTPTKALSTVAALSRRAAKSGNSQWRLNAFQPRGHLFSKT
jgi:hypothetical protein